MSWHIWWHVSRHIMENKLLYGSLHNNTGARCLSMLQCLCHRELIHQRIFLLFTRQKEFTVNACIQPFLCVVHVVLLCYDMCISACHSFPLRWLVVWANNLAGSLRIVDGLRCKFHFFNSGCNHYCSGSCAGEFVISNALACDALQFANRMRLVRRRPHRSISAHLGMKVGDHIF